MYKLSTLAVLALIGTSEGVKIHQTELASHDKEDNLFLSEVQATSSFESGLTGFYEGTPVKVIDGDDIQKTLLNGGNIGDKPMLVVAYTPTCPHC